MPRVGWQLLGADLRLTGGYYAPRWFIGGEVGLDWVAATHITFKKTYRTRVYAGAKDGWYGLAGGTGYVGLHAGVSFSSFDVVVRAGHPRTMKLEEQTVPFYMTVGVNVTLPQPRSRRAAPSPGRAVSPRRCEAGPAPARSVTAVGMQVAAEDDHLGAGPAEPGPSHASAAEGYPLQGRTGRESAPLIGYRFSALEPLLRFACQKVRYWT